MPYFPRTYSHLTELSHYSAARVALFSHLQTTLECFIIFKGKHIRKYECVDGVPNNNYCKYYLQITTRSNLAISSSILCTWPYSPSFCLCFGYYHNLCVCMSLDSCPAKPSPLFLSSYDQELIHVVF